MSRHKLRAFRAVTSLALLCVTLSGTPKRASGEEGAHRPKALDLSGMELVWEDDFDYPDAQLEAKWDVQNGPNKHILCSRWRENVIVKDGVLHLENRKEKRGGQDWTSGSIWTKRRFKYGYFECRYRYAEATGTNNSFWLMTWGTTPKEGKKFEIDINEGHYPNEVSTNIHNHSDVLIRPDGRKSHPTSVKNFRYGVEDGYSMQLESPVTTKKLRLTSTHPDSFHVCELRAYGVSDAYPDPMSPSADKDIEGIINHSASPRVKFTASGMVQDWHNPERAADGKLNTSWVPQRAGKKFLEFEWHEPVTIGCLQLVNGWRKDGEWTGYGRANNFKIQWHDGQAWKDLAAMDVKEHANLGAEFHTYGLLWTEDELVFYKDRKEIRREPNEFSYSESPIFLSEAIIKWGGEITDAIDGTSMKVDWVRYYK